VATNKAAPDTSRSALDITRCGGRVRALKVVAASRCSGEMRTRRIVGGEPRADAFG